MEKDPERRGSLCKGPVAKGIMKVGELQENQHVGMKRFREEVQGEAGEIDGVRSSRDLKFMLKPMRRYVILSGFLFGRKIKQNILATV